MPGKPITGELPGSGSGCQVRELLGGLLHGGHAIKQFADGIPTTIDEGIAGRLAERGGHGLSGEADLHLHQVEGDLGGGILLHGGRNPGDVLAPSTEAGEPERGAVAEEDLSVALGDHGAYAEFLEGLRSMLAGGAAAKIGTREQNGSALETGLIERMRLVRAVGVLAHVVKEEFAEAVEGDALHEARRDDTVGVDIVTRDSDGPAGERGDFRE